MHILPNTLKRWNYDAIYKINSRPIKKGCESVPFQQINVSLLSLRKPADALKENSDRYGCVSTMEQCPSG